MVALIQEQRPQTLQQRQWAIVRLSAGTKVTQMTRVHAKRVTSSPRWNALWHSWNSKSCRTHVATRTHHRLRARESVTKIYGNFSSLAISFMSQGIHLTDLSQGSHFLHTQSSAFLSWALNLRMLWFTQIAIGTVGSGRLHATTSTTTVNHTAPSMSRLAFHPFSARFRLQSWNSSRSRT